MDNYAHSIDDTGKAKNALLKLAREHGRQEKDDSSIKAAKRFLVNETADYAFYKSHVKEIRL